MPELPPLDGVGFGLHEIGRKGELSPEGARRAAMEFVASRNLTSHAEHMLAVGGYDEDPRALWDIPEAAAFVKEFVGWVALIDRNRPLLDWKLDQASMGLVAMCCGFGRLVDVDPSTGHWKVEIGTPGGKG